MKKRLLILSLFSVITLGVWAQRTVDVIDRGLVAVKAAGGVLCTWRIHGEEYYDVAYNIYRDGTKINDKPLTVSNFKDTAGSLTSKYTVAAVVRGVEQEKSKEATVLASNYLELEMDHGTMTNTFVPNDATAADLDGDGEMELIIKFDNWNSGVDGKYTVVEAYKLNGKKLWWIDCGRNMGDFQNNEINIAAYDWDMDGKAECVFRAADGTVIHMADGTTQTIGDPSKNYRPAEGGGQWFVHDGAEFLLYMNGETGKPYVVMDYPLVRLEPGEGNQEQQWGDGYGHRSSKYFFGAPYFDGRKPSIFLARGIYTRHKMIAYDVDPATHKLTERWRWNCNTGGPWFGQGYHNYCIGDVDWDGRDEIVFGAMTIDDNGRGLATTGLGHGDAMHLSDFDPYRHGQEFFACNESAPANNYCDATTRKILYRYAGGTDDGRGMMGNFTDLYPGAQGTTARDGNLISSVTYSGIPGGTKNNISQNMRIYWDGDLCEETFNYASGKNTAGVIIKYGTGVIATLQGSMTNNDTKGTPCLQADIFGDWREEVVMRTADNKVRIYTTNTQTPWRNYTLWHDHQYRNAVVWQMNGYNQPPHTSYFLGKLEGITMAPPATIMTGRTEVKNQGTIGADANDKQIITCETNDMTVAVADGASPYIYFDNAPSWVQGTDINGTSGKNPTINYAYYVHTLTGGGFAGGMRLVKQGDGTLILPNAVQKYTGNTDVWAGTLQFDGTMEGSRVWLNRHTTLISNGGVFKKAIQADYNATIIPGGQGHKGTLTADSLILNFGSQLRIDLFGADGTADVIKTNVLVIEKKDWENGPEYSTPVLTFVANTNDATGKVADGKYLIGEIGTIVGSLDNLLVKGLTGQKGTLIHEDGKLYVEIINYTGGNMTWTGSVDGVWDVDNTKNFINNGTADGTAFIPGSEVTFDDNAQQTTVKVVGNVAPASIIFKNEKKSFTITGDSIVGGANIEKSGAGVVSVSNENRVGNTYINGGRIVVANFANEIGQEFGGLGSVKSAIYLDNGGTLANTKTATSAQPVYVGRNGGTLQIAAGSTLTLSTGVRASASGAQLTKTGTGTLALGANNSVGTLIIAGGTVNASESGGVTQLPTTVEFQNGTLNDPNGEGSYTTNRANFYVPEGKTGTFYADPRCNYTGTLTGAGTFKVHAAGVRNYFQGNWSEFEGTLEVGMTKRGQYDPWFAWDNTYGLPKATLNVPANNTFDNNGKNVEIGTVMGAGTLAGSGTFILGTNDADFTLGINSTAKIQKRGEGIMRIMALGKVQNTITVSAGTLMFNEAALSTLVHGAFATTLNGTGQIIGQGLLNSLVMSGESMLTPRSMYSESTPGVIKTKALLNVNGGTTVNFLVGSGKNSQLQPQMLTMNGTIKVTLLDGYTPQAGDSFTLWQVVGTFKGTPSFDLPELPAGLVWDTTELLQKTGVLKVVVDTSIDGITLSEPVDADIYTLSGQKVGSVRTTKASMQRDVKALGTGKGTYIINVRANGKGGTMKMVVE
jgi:autotransporter-associated beta strand protein